MKWLALVVLLIGCTHQPKQLKLLPETHQVEVVLLNHGDYIGRFIDYVAHKGWNEALGVSVLRPIYGSHKNLECGKIYVIFSEIAPMYPWDPDPVGLRRTLAECLTIIQLDPGLLDNLGLFHAAFSHELGHAFSLRHSTEEGSIMQDKVKSSYRITEQDVQNLRKTPQRIYKQLEIGE